MELLEQRAIEFIEKLQKIYFVDRDLDTVFSMFDEDITWIGTGKNEICHGIKEAKEFFEAEKNLFHGSFRILSIENNASVIQDSLVLVYGSIVIHENTETESLSDVTIRTSVICRAYDDEFRIKQVHMSSPSSEQREGAFFPKVFSGENIEFLHNLVEEQTLRINERNRDLNMLLTNLPGAVICCDTSESLILFQVGGRFYDMFGYDRDEIESTFGNSYAAMIYEEDKETVSYEIKNQLLKGSSIALDYRVVCKDGSLMWVMERGQKVEIENGKEVFYCVLLDTTDAKNAQEELRLSLERHQIIMDQTTDIIFEWDIANDTLMFSSNWEKKFGYRPIMNNVSTEILINSRIYKDDINMFIDIMRNTANGTPYSETEFRIAKADGQYIWCKIRATLQTDADSRPSKAIGVIIDIDNERKQEEALREKAEKDVLTDLYNKGTTQELIEKALLKASKANEMCALYLLDIDNFKEINDIYGHLSGDVILSDIARALRKQFRGDDIIGRVGGDEFAVFIKNISDMNIVEEKAKAILHALTNTYKGENEYDLSCSIGISISPRDGEEFRDLYRSADIALYHSKKLGKNTFSMYSDNLSGFYLNENYGIYKPREDMIESDGSSRVLNSNFAEYVFRMLYQSKDVETAIPLILEIVGKQFDVSRVYIFEDSEDGKYCRNTFEWCSSDVERQQMYLQNVSYEELGDYYSNFNENDIFYCSNINNLSKSQKDILEMQGIKSLLQCVIRDNGKAKGFVGFDECRENRLWKKEQIDILTLISEFLSTFLLKKRAQFRTSHTLQVLKTILDNQDSWLYVIEKNTFKTLYANKKTVNLIPDIVNEGKCHKLFFGRDDTCESCPIIKLESNNGCSEKTVIYSEILNKRVSVSVKVIPWLGDREAYLMSCVEID